MEYDRTNTGILFKNDSENEKAPKYTGKINVGGTDYKLAAWIRESKSGDKFLSLKVTELNDNGSAKPRPKPKQEAFDDIDSDVPW